MTSINHDKLAEDAGYERLPDFLVAVARAEIGPKALQDLLKPPPADAQEPEALAPTPRKSRAAGRSSVLVVGVDKLLTVTAKCCKPVPPEPIVGFVTRGRGVSVHRVDCQNLQRLAPERRVDAEWGEAAGATFPVDVAIEAVDRTGLLRDISDVLTRERVNVIGTATQSSAQLARMRFTLEIENLDQLQRVLGLVRDVKGVTSAARR
jgi:GTP pyrophosphokinase